MHSGEVDICDNQLSTIAQQIFSQGVADVSQSLDGYTSPWQVPATVGKITSLLYSHELTIGSGSSGWGEGTSGATHEVFSIFLPDNIYHFLVKSHIGSGETAAPVSYVT